MPDPKNPHELAEKLIETAEADESTDDLLRGTEVYEEDVDDYEEEGVEELDFEPEEDSSGHIDAQDGYVEEDDY